MDTGRGAAAIPSTAATPRIAAQPFADRLAKPIELLSAPFAAAVDRSIESSQESQQPAELRRRYADCLEQGAEQITNPAAAARLNVPTRYAPMSYRERIGRQNRPRAATTIAGRAVRCRIELPTGKIHAFKLRIT
jgi:hypothetical protein